MKSGTWLAFNFEYEEGTKLMKYFNDTNFPQEILNPLSLYSEEVLKKVTKGTDNFTKNDNFRLVFISKSVLVPT
jgi:hypothetical protein